MRRAQTIAIIMDGYASVEEEKKMYKLNDMTDLVSTNIFKQARMGFRWRMPAVAPCRGVADHAPPTASCGKDHGRGALVALWGRERAKCFTSCLSASSPRGLARGAPPPGPYLMGGGVEGGAGSGLCGADLVERRNC